MIFYAPRSSTRFIKASRSWPGFFHHEALIALTLYLIFRIPDSRLRKFPTSFSLVEDDGAFLCYWNPQNDIYTRKYICIPWDAKFPHPKNAGFWISWVQFPGWDPGSQKNRNSWQPGRGFFASQPSRAWFFLETPFSISVPVVPPWKNGAESFRCLSVEVVTDGDWVIEPLRKTNELGWFWLVVGCLLSKLHSLKPTNAKSRCICYWNGLMSIAMFVSCRAIICVYIFSFFPYIYIRNVPYIQTLFPFFQIAASKKRSPGRRSRSVAFCPRGCGDPAARIVQEIFRLQKTSFGTAETVADYFSHKAPFEKNYLGKEMGSSSPQNFRAESF